MTCIKKFNFILSCIIKYSYLQDRVCGATLHDCLG